MRTPTLGLACALALCWPAASLAQTFGSVQDARDRGQGRLAEVTPYIEAAQVLTAELSPNDDVVTYTSVAAGVDATLVGRNSTASVSLRYERRFGWEDNQRDGDTLSGVARASLAVVPRAVTLEAGGMAARTRVEGNGATALGGFGGDDRGTSQLYAGYIGPAVHTQAGDLEMTGQYLLGYTRVEAPDAVLVAPGAQRADVFDDSVTHLAAARVGVRPDTVAPIGVGIGGGWNQQEVSNLDQRIVDRHVRGDVTVPLEPTLALVGGVGYEDVEVSSRDALRDGGGNPVIGPDGRYVTDESAPRRIAYQTEGLIWDAGVMWRPSRRTSLLAQVGERYGSMTFTGLFAYAPNSRTSVNVVVYDSLTGFGGALVGRLSELPVQFDAFRNPITGEIGGCVAPTGPSGQAGGETCLASALGSIRSAVFRGRGVAGSYSLDLGRTQLGIAGGYDRRTFIAAAGTVLAPANGVADETVWLAGYARTRLDELSALSANAYANWFESGFDLTGNAINYSATLAYDRRFIRGLSGIAAVGLDGITRDDLPDFSTASALLGLRYAF